MAMITNSTGNTIATVDSISNGLVVQNPKTVAQAGFTNLSGQVDSGSVTGSVLNRNIIISPSNRLEASLSSPLMSDTFNYAAQDTARWSFAPSGLTQSFSGGFTTINAAAAVTAGAWAVFKSYWTHPFPSEGVAVFRMLGFLVNAAQANAVAEFGFLYAAGGVAAPTDGSFFRFDATGTLKGVVNYNGTEITTGALTQPTPGVMSRWNVIIDKFHVEFWINGILVGTINTPNSVGQPIMSSYLQPSIRIYNSASAPTLAQILKISNIDIWCTDGNINKPWAQVQSEQGLQAYQGVSGMTMGSTALVANSANPTAAVPSNTTAALGSGLGGIFWETATLAVTPVDGIISSYQNPSQTVNIAGRKLVITGISWNSIVQTVLAGGPFVYSHFLCFGHTAVSLATVEAAATKAPRRIALGVSTFAATAAVGTLGATITRTFQSPIVINPGEFIATVVRQNGTVGTSGTIQHLITFDGYWA